MKRLAIVSTHPIQYNAPFFRLLAEEPSIELKVFYTKSAEAVRFDKDFGQTVVWDIPLTEGYKHETIPATERAGRKALIAAIETFQPHAVLVYGWNFPGHWAIMRHFKGNVPVWFRGDSTLLDPMPFGKRILRRMLLKAVYKSIDLAFYVGQANKQYFHWAGLLDHQLRYAPHAVDNEFFLAESEKHKYEAVQLRKTLGIPIEATVFLFVGKMEEKKQPALLGKAILSLNTQNAHLVYIGSGSQLEYLKTSFDSSPYIHFVGFQNQQSMPLWYTMGDVLCLPSKGPEETWGLAVNEAIACGCYIIISNRVGCSSDVIPTEEIGLVFDVSDEDQLLEKLRKVTDSNVRLGAKAKVEFLEIFRYENFRDSILAEL